MNNERTYNIAEVTCLKCLSVARPVCSCGNVAALRDRDDDINIYVDDIRTCRLADIYKDGDTEVYRELHQPFDTMVYVNYSPIRNTSLNFVKMAPERRKRVYSKLREALDNYKHVTAAKDRVGTTRKRMTRRGNER